MGGKSSEEGLASQVAKLTQSRHKYIDNVQKQGILGPQACPASNRVGMKVRKATEAAGQGRSSYCSETGVSWQRRITVMRRQSKPIMTGVNNHFTHPSCLFRLLLQYPSHGRGSWLNTELHTEFTRYTLKSTYQVS